MTHRTIRALPVTVLATLLLVGCLAGTAQATGSGAHGKGAAFAAAASKNLPRLLKEDFSSRFGVRPATLEPTGDGSIVMGKLAKRGRHIHWHVWNATEAYGVATVWVDNGIPNVAQGKFHGFGGTVHAYRIRDGRFTRLTVHYRKAGKLKAWSLALEHVGKLGWTWRTR